MKSRTHRRSSLFKNVTSIVMGAVFAAAIYANAVYVPENRDQLTADLSAQTKAIESGQSLLIPDQDGYRVTERIPELPGQDKATQSENIEKIIAEIAKLEEALSVEEEVSTPAQLIVRSAPNSQSAPRVAQTADEITEAARQTSSLTSLPFGATLGSLAAICADPMLRAGALEVISVSAAPGGLAAAISNGGGLSSQGTAVLALLGVSNVGGIGGGSATSNSGGSVGAAASTNPGSTTSAPSSP